LWECPTCHGEYHASIFDREVGDDSCPYCNNKRTLPGFNSLTDTHKLLAAEWSSNNSYDTSNFMKSHTYWALWECPTCHGEYNARICDREVGDDSCPYCSNRKAFGWIYRYLTRTAF
jgi:rubrerythrin